MAFQPPSQVPAFISKRRSQQQMFPYQKKVNLKNIKPEQVPCSGFFILQEALENDNLILHHKKQLPYRR